MMSRVKMVLRTFNAANRRRIYKEIKTEKNKENNIKASMP